MISHAKFNRNFVRAGLLAAALSYVPLSHAFSTMNPPLGWTPGGGPGGSMNIPAATAAGGSYGGGAWSGTGSLAAGGRAASIPASGRLAAGAARAAAAALFAHPGVRAAAAAAAWLGAADFLYDAAKGLWYKPGGDGDAEPSQGLEYRSPYSPDGVFFSSPSAACNHGGNARAASLGGSLVSATISGSGWVVMCRSVVKNAAGGLSDDNGTQLGVRQGSCPVGWYITSAGCVQNPPPAYLNQPQFVDGLTGHPMPDGVPNILPFPLPVGFPEIVPLFLPTGNPVPNPDYDSSKPQTGQNQPFLQPGVRVTGAPTTANPWQVDVQPVNRPVASGEPNSDPVPLDPGTGNPGKDDKPKSEETQDLCEKNPDILACMKVEKPDFDTPDGGELPKKTENVTMDDADLFGSGSCPADARMSIRGGQSIMVWDWSETCNAARNYVQPVFLVAGAFAALMIVLGGTRSS